MDLSKKEIIKTSLAPEAVGTYSQWINLGGLYLFSGQIGLDPQSMNMRETFDQQLDQILKNVDGLLDSCQLKREDIIKTTIFMTDLSKFDRVNKAYTEYFKAPYPARSTVEVSGLPKGAEIEIEVMAAKG